MQRSGSTVFFSIALAFATPQISAQASGSYTTYGTGCKGSGVSAGPVLPAGYATKFGGRGNAFPWGWYNQHYMQGHDANELPATVVVRGLAFRNRANFVQNAYTLDITLRVGYTKNAPRSMNRTFAANWSGNPTVGFTGKLNVPSAAASNTPTTWTLRVPFRVPFIYTRPRGNFVWETINTTASRPQTNYFDAATGANLQVSRIYATGSSATAGSVGVGYGICTQVLGTGGGATVTLGNTGVPRINRTFSVNVGGAVPSSVAILWLGAQKLNTSLNPVLPGCTLYTSLNVLLGGVATGTSGNASMMFTLPNSSSLVGIRYYNQWMVVDKAANGIGVVLSNGGEAQIGS